MKNIFIFFETSAKLTLFVIAVGKQRSFVKSSLEHEENLTSIYGWLVLH